MRKFHTTTAVVVALAMFGGAGAAFAAPVFSVAAPGSGMAIDDFASQLVTFNAADVTDLVGAKTVSVLKYDTAWTRPKELSRSVNFLSDDAQSIGLLREAIKKDPAAVKLLTENHIAVDNVVDITSDGAGAVSIYVS